ncbi:MAG TPA: replicative DNA helicase [Trueperaceae bacterium]
MKLRMPHDLDAERAVLGAVMLDARLLDALDLDADAWYAERHALIWQAMCRLRDEGRPIDTVTLRAALGDDLPKAGGLGYLTALLDAVASTANAEHYAQRVREMAARRRLVELGMELMERAAAGGDAETLADFVEQGLVAAQRLADPGRPTIRRLDHVAAERLRHLYETRDQEDAAEGVPTGYFDLDRYTGGLPRGGLSVVAARPSIGKSALAQCIAENAARSGRTVLLFSPEQTAAEIADRLIARHGAVNSVRLRRRQLEDAEWRQATAGLRRLQNLPWWVDDSGDLTSQQVRSRARQLHARRPVDLVIVDYLQFLGDRPDRSTNSRAELVGAMSRRLKALARELNCALLACSQLNRAAERRADHRPMLSDLRESGNIEQDADLVLLLHRPEYYDPQDRPGIAEVEIAKQRNGPTGLVELRFNRRLVAFENLARRQDVVPAVAGEW